MKTKSKMLFILPLMLALACSFGCQKKPKTYNSYMIEYDSIPLSKVVDSIVTSGTVLGEWSDMMYVLDSNDSVMIQVSTLYRDSLPVGSISAYPVDSSYSVVRVIDTVEAK